MDAKPIDPNTPLDDLHPARFLKVSDLLDRWHVQFIIVKIAHLTREETIPNPKETEPDPARQGKTRAKVVVQPVLYFHLRKGEKQFSEKAFSRGLLLSAKADTEALKAATKAQTVGELAGKQIKIYVSEHKGSAVLRIDPNPPA